MRSSTLGLVALVLLLDGTLARSAFATDVSDELSAGALWSNTVRGNSPFVSDRLGGSFDPNDELSLSLDGTFTRYFKSKGSSGESIFQIAGAADYSPGDHWSFGADFRGSPPSTTTVPDGSGGKYRYTSSLVGGGVSAEYDTANDGDVDTIGDTYLGLTSYRTTQRAKPTKDAPATTIGTPSSLLQWRLSLGLTEVLWQNTEAGLTGTYYVYSEDPVGYDGASLYGRGGVDEGVPLEPMRWAIRPSVRQRFGALKLSLYAQYGRYVEDSGYSVLAAFKAQLKLSDDVRLWGQIGFQRDGDSLGETLSIPWGSVGARVML